MSIGSVESEQIHQQLSSYELASKVQKNNFNIRRFTENRIKNKKQLLRTKYTENSKIRMSTEAIEERVKGLNTSLSETTAFDRMMSKKQPNRTKRMLLTGSLKHTAKQNLTLNKQLIATLQHDKVSEELAESTRAKQCRQMAKKHNKGPLRRKIIETWMNSILMQSTQFDVVDQSVSNAALKKFQIDENSMLSRGVKLENIKRIYQALFVHSIGFNNSIKQLVSNNNQVMKNVWRVFSILLEYCAQGKFETLIGVIERDKVMKVEELREEIAKRQQIIEKNDELNQTKNIQIYKQIRQLKQENINLTNEKDVLLEDYQKTEQAFNEQVSLRLKFQNKINQLFGVHRQLAIKHQRLYDDYKKKIVQWNTTNQKNTIIVQQIGELKIQINDLTTDKQRLLISEKYNKEMLSAVKIQKIKLNDECNIVKHQYDDERRINKQFKRRITQLEIQIKNLTQIVIIKDKSWLETHQEYQLSLEQNRRLYTILTEQRKQIEQLLFQKKQFNNKTLNIVADASLQRKKKEQFAELYYASDSYAKSLNEKIRELELQNKIACKKSCSLEDDLKANYENICKMHEKNDELESELEFLRNYKIDIDALLNQKNQQNLILNTKNEQLFKQNQQLKSILVKAQMNYKVLKGQFDHDIEMNKQRNDKIKQQREQMQNVDITRGNQLNFAKIQLSKTNKSLQNTVLQLKNQRFQRVHLKTNYQQSLNIIQKKNQEEKRMGRQISQLKDLLQKLTQETTHLRLSLQSQIAKKQKYYLLYNQTKMQYQLYKQQKCSFIHPFQFQDLAQRYRILSAKLITIESTLLKQTQQIKQIDQKYTTQITMLTKSNNQFFIHFKKQKQKELQHKQSQLEYEKQITTSMKQRLQNLQQLAEVYSKKIQERTTSEKQKIYSQIIEQKTKSIQSLITKLALETKTNQQLQIQLIKTNQSHQQLLTSLKQKLQFQIQIRDQKINQLEFYQNHYQNQIKKFKEELINYSNKFQQKLKQSMLNYMQNYRNLESTGIQEHREDVSQTVVLNKGVMVHCQLQKNSVNADRIDISRKLQNAYAHYQNK